MSKAPGLSGNLNIRRARIVSGVILFIFVTLHLLNHALGLVSIDAMDKAREWRIAITRNEIGGLIIAGAAITHMILGVMKFVQRRTWRIHFGEFIQLAFGLLIPLLLFRHFIGTRIANEVYGVDDNYTYALYVMWPNEALWQAALITLVWIHGCIGLHMWLRIKEGYDRFIPSLAAIALLVPFLGYAGFVAAGRQIRHERSFSNPFTSEQIRDIYNYMDIALYAYAAVLASLIAFRLIRDGANRFKSRIRVRYTDGLELEVPPGPTILELSRAYDIPHASICGGRGRCSTCRIRVTETAGPLPERNEIERRLLERVGASGQVRLGCQLRPNFDIEVSPLLPAKHIRASDVALFDKYHWGVEQTVTILFSDIRGFTKLSEDQLAYDVVFLLNLYLSRMSEAITDAGGYVDKFMGDGIMAIFGIRTSPEDGARQALAAAREMGGILDGLNQSLRKEIGRPLDIGIGIHTGGCVLGRIGAGNNHDAGNRMTALGDTVNAASRLESSTKDLGVQLVISKATIDAAGIDLPGEEQSIAVKGKNQLLHIKTLKRALDLPALSLSSKSTSPRRKAQA